MLVLTRGERQSVTIGDNIVVTINRVNGKYVKVGIEAPSDVSIRRTELPPKGKDENDANE